MREFHLLPDGTQSGNTILDQGELITAIEIPHAAPYSTYLKIRGRESYEFATVSAGVALDLDRDRRISQVRIALGAVAARPWRLDAAERALVGLHPDSPVIRKAVEGGFADARPLSQNAYKIPLSINTVLRALRLATEMVPCT